MNMSAPHDRRSQDPLTQAQVDIGRLEEQVKHLASSVDRLNTSLIAVQETLAQAQGGWRTLMYIGGMGATLGAGVAWIITHLSPNVPPP